MKQRIFHRVVGGFFLQSLQTVRFCVTVECYAIGVV